MVALFSVFTSSTGKRVFRTGRTRVVIIANAYYDCSVKYMTKIFLILVHFIQIVLPFIHIQLYSKIDSPATGYHHARRLNKMNKKNKKINKNSINNNNNNNINNKHQSLCNIKNSYVD